MTTRLPLRHLSIRVPWHDAGWNGTICADPGNNASCLRLPNIHDRREDAVEIKFRGRRLDELQPAELPPCLAERAAFMANFPITRHVRHPYSATSEAHRHYRPTPVDVPPFSAEAVPFRWMRREDAARLAGDFDIVYRDEAEDAARQTMGFESAWVQDRENQSNLLDAFFSAVEPERSLAFFYAKEVPHTEQRRRVLVGVGWVTGCGHGVEYRYEPSAEHPTRSMIWERVVNHSIRPDNREGGFLLPYHAALGRAAEDPDFNPEDVVVFAPDEAFEQFSYASEHLTHDQAIASLLAMVEGLQRAGAVLGSSFEEQIRWAQARLGELWKLRGPFPGLGAALGALGVDHPDLLAYRITESLPAAQDPWPAVQAALDDPASLGPEWVGRVGPTIAHKLGSLAPERRALLHLISRLDATSEQAERLFVREIRSKAGIDVDDAALLGNPYLLYEADRLNEKPISVTTVDRGVYPPSESPRLKLPSPSAMSEPQDPRRVRALSVAVLEDAAERGHTVMPQDDIVSAVREMAVAPPCPIDGDLLGGIVDKLEPAVRQAQLDNGAPAFQLDRFRDARDKIRNEVTKRSNAAKRHSVEADWHLLLDAQLSPLERDGALAQDEARAREEKIAALQELAEARFSVLIGSAGTGKTTLLAALCTHLAEHGTGVTLLAPTGKARVQAERRLRGIPRVQALTIAQFLVQHGRYVPRTGRYCRSRRPPAITGGNLIIDEASMVTEEQLDAVLDNVRQSERIILVGDPRQLPPIGAGRPFVDIVEHLKDGVVGEWPRIGPSYAELVTPMRQREGSDPRSSRYDLALGSWFSGEAPTPEVEEAWGELLSGRSSDTVRFEQWDTPTDVFDLVCHLLPDEFDEIEDIDDQAGFGASLGGVCSGIYVYFNESREESDGAGPKSENWQILSPIHATGAGVAEINRAVHLRYRADLIASAREIPRWGRKVPKPMGPEGIVYGDKVMNNRNHGHDDVWPPDASHGENEHITAAKYVANGEIGMVVGQFKRRGQKFTVRKLEVEFSTQPGFKYGFGGRWLPRDGDAILELAYAITIHKSQGSEFGKTFVVIPNPCALLSRELLYTALTRHRERVIVLHQGPLEELLAYGSDRHSETARRLTNLFRDPQPQDVGDGRFLEANLIHRTTNGTLVRSKSEVIVANELSAADIDFAYEKGFQGHDGTLRYPDFTIESAATGETLIWEHLGMLSDPRYAQAWERKREWYANSGVEEGGGERATLIVTEDDSNGGIDSAAVQAKVREIA
ncbi:MAG: AAA family ATPase [Acidimicrobiales bacterium]|nr:AAA family ATPase [Acidimicrobiales bacterium]MYD33471.1 AAA family ATPase [Acidimicrobiales bacterium]MYI10019.1 AAA family ATPase [Acidimicrobiales bacterium]